MISFFHAASTKSKAASPIVCISLLSLYAILSTEMYTPSEVSITVVSYFSESFFLESKAFGLRLQRLSRNRITFQFAYITYLYSISLSLFCFHFSLLHLFSLFSCIILMEIAWLAPDQGTAKINVHSTPVTNNTSGLGVILRNSEGHKLWGIAGPVEGLSPTQVAL